MTKESYVDFEMLDSTGKTNRWQVQTRDTRTALGSVHWFGRWRCYAFFPLQGTVYERKCLRDIADFCELVTQQWRDAKKAKPDTVNHARTGFFSKWERVIKGTQ